MIKPDVEDARKDTYYTTVVLHTSRKEDYQLVFASQVYGTFFGIYAKFDVTRIDTKNVKLNAITFRMINYKGLINVGIQKIKPISQPDKDVKLHIIFNLKGLMDPLQDVHYDLTDQNITLGSDDKVVFERKMVKFTDDRDGIFDNGAFDDEFYFRDGLFPIDAPKSKLEDEIKRHYPRTKQTLGSRCPKTLVKIITNG